MDTTIDFKGTVSWSRFKSAQWTHFGTRWMVLLLFPVAMTAYYWATGTELSVAMWLLIFLVSCTFVPLMLAFYVMMWRRTYAQSPYLQHQLFGSVSPDKLVIEGVTGRTEMTWNQFVRVREGKGVILLYQGPHLFVVLAREFFESDDAWETTQRFARRVPG
jgi:preprotein translocase subunit YajC